MASVPIRVVVFGENVHEQTLEEVRNLYPRGMHGCIADALDAADDVRATTVTLEMPDHGLTEEALAETDVLVWWGHAAQDQVLDSVADRVVRAVNAGMGLIVLHSACLSKPFTRLMGTTGDVSWREAGERERLWKVVPTHPIVAGIPGDFFELEREEMYGEPFNIPTPDEVLLISWFAGGEVCRSCCTWRRGAGKVVYFRPGHETYPTYHDPNVQRVLANAVRWARPEGRVAWTCFNRRAELAPEPLARA